jgi:ATP-dependent Clp protease, protease subunit
MSKNPLHKFVAAKQGDTLVLHVYDAIGETMVGEGVTAKSVAAKLDSAGSFGRIQMRISSGGGDPFEALAISNLLKAKAVPIEVTVDGLAASAASLLAMAGDTILMGSGAMMMVHAASTFSFGNASELRAMADTLDQVSLNMADVYAARTGLPKAEVVAIMDAETWFTAEEAVAKGFANGIVPGETRASAVAASFDLSSFKHVPTALKAEAESYTREELLRMRLKLA